MKNVDQSRFFKAGESAGDCARAAIASILYLPLEKVPDFPTHDAVAHWDAIDAFLAERGIERFLMPGNYCPDVHYLASGPAARGCAHMVVMFGGKLAHDPHPSRAGLISVDHVNVLVPVHMGQLFEQCGSLVHSALQPKEKTYQAAAALLKRIIEASKDGDSGTFLDAFYMREASALLALLPDSPPPT